MGYPEQSVRQEIVERRFEYPDIQGAEGLELEVFGKTTEFLPARLRPGRILSLPAGLPCPFHDIKQCLNPVDFVHKAGEGSKFNVRVCAGTGNRSPAGVQLIGNIADKNKGIHRDIRAVPRLRVRRLDKVAEPDGKPHPHHPAGQGYLPDRRPCPV